VRGAALVKPEVIAVGGSKVPAGANDERMLDFGQLAREIIADAKRIDAEEDELCTATGAGMSCRRSCPLRLVIGVAGGGDA
jgi:hypothetical protein